ncbi:hypothetical protein INR49_024583 [Caranx melampygus]|nr:hypothetical protein INR49_024583 [Caranx melampygus]
MGEFIVGANGAQVRGPRLQGALLPGFQFDYWHILFESQTQAVTVVIQPPRNKPLGDNHRKMHNNHKETTTKRQPQTDAQQPQGGNNIKTTSLPEAHVHNSMNEQELMFSQELRKYESTAMIEK